MRTEAEIKAQIKVAYKSLHEKGWNDEEGRCRTRVIRRYIDALEWVLE